MMADADEHGYFYFTKKKNIFFTSQHEGEDTISYLIGKYSITSQGITCKFDREYSFYTGVSKGQTQSNPNSGKIKKRNLIEFKLGKLKCEYFDFNFIQGENTDVLRKSGGDISNYFFATFNKVKAFGRY
jgi:hypothetical protein